MNAERLLELYDRIVEAPDAVSRLRRFVLDLAVRGELVEQDTEDEPASKMLDRLTVEKLRLADAGAIPKSKNIATTVDNKPFQVPCNWVWARLEDLTEYLQRGKSPRYASGAGHPIISQKCVQWRGLDLSVAKQVDSSSLDTYEPHRFLRNGDLLWNSTGTGTIGRVIRLADPPRSLICDGHVTVVRCLLVNSEYIRTWLRSDYVYGVIEQRAAGGTKQVELTARLARNQPVPLPPLKEQHRIVAKVDELMAICDRLEETHNTREATRDRLTTASLTRLTAPDTDDQTFQSRARFALDTLPALTARPDQIKAVRQTILDLAVRGKLVAQDSDEIKDSPLDDALQASRSRELDNEIPFEPPEGWLWVRLSDVAKFENGDRSKRYPKRSEYVSNGVPWINTGHIREDGYLCEETMNFISEEKFDSLGSGKIKPGDVLYCLRGATFGKTAFVEPFEKGAVASSLMIIRPSTMIDRRFTYFYLTSPLGREQLDRFDNGTAQPNLSSASVRQYLLPLPPITVQCRIVSKVDELLSLCDQLETSLTRAETTRSRLLESVLRNALRPTAEDLEAA